MPPPSSNYCPISIPFRKPQPDETLRLINQTPFSLFCLFFSFEMLEIIAKNPAGSHEVSPAGPSRPTGTSWKDTEIMKPMNMQRAMAKPILGRPPNTSTTMAATPAPTRTNPAAHPLQPSPPTPDTPPPLDDQGLITRTAPATDVMEEGCL